MELATEEHAIPSIGLFDFYNGKGGYLLILFLAVVVPLWTVKRTHRQLPPGPWSLPILGYLPFLGNEPYRLLDKLRKKYGSVFGLYLGRQYVVVLGDFSAIQEAYNKEEFLGRPPHPPNLLVPNTTSFSSRNGQTWREHRRFALQSLRELGFAKTVSEEDMLKEIDYLMIEIDKSQGEPLDIRDMLSSSISNNITTLIIGRRLDFSDPKRQHLDKKLDLLAKFYKPTSLHAYFPWARSILMSLRMWGYGTLKDTLDELQQFLKEEIEQHRKTLDSNRPRDYIDKFLIEMNHRGLDTSATFTVQMLKGNVISLLTAGSEPVIATVNWVLATMATYPDVQMRIQKEIDEVTGGHIPPSWNHHKRMPFTQAAIMEVQRWRTVLPINMLRRTLADTVIQGYTIPKGTFILSNMWAIDRDPVYWENPEMYRPERFLDSSGTEVKKYDHFVPFSYGKRNCPGLSLGKIEVFLYVTSLLQKYTLQLPDGRDPTQFNDLGITLMLRPFKLRFLPRSS